MDPIEAKEQPKRPPVFELSPEQVTTTKQIIKGLNELNGRVRFQISSIVYLLGIEKANDLYARAVAIQEKGGIPYPEENRNRSGGEVLVHLAGSLHQVVFPKFGEPHIKSSSAKTASAQPAAQATKDGFALTWENRKLLVNEALQNQGTSAGAKVIITGRPASVAQKGDSVVIVLQQNLKQTGLPKGVPFMTTPTTYIVYIGKKQWAKCTAVFDDPNDALMIEGLQTYDAEYQAMAILATNVTTRSAKMNKANEEKTADTAPTQ